MKFYLHFDKLLTLKNSMLQRMFASLNQINLQKKSHIIQEYKKAHQQYLIAFDQIYKYLFSWQSILRNHSTETSRNFGLIHAALEK